MFLAALAATWAATREPSNVASATLDALPKIPDPAAFIAVGIGLLAIARWRGRHPG